MQERGFAHALLDALLPRVCCLCREAAPASDPCADCERSLAHLRLDRVCPRCAAPLGPTADGGGAPTSAAQRGRTSLPATTGPERGSTTSDGSAAAPAPVRGPCPACLARPPPFERVVAPWRFAPPLSGLIHRMKYRRDLAAAAALGRLLAREVAARLEDGPPPPDTVIGLPLSTRRLVHRGFNHADELAAVVRRELGARRARGVRIARRHSPPQARAKSAAARFANVAGVFTVHRWPPDRSRVAIVDDVLTTGATASALARALRARGVERVEVWCCARTPLDD